MKRLKSIRLPMAEVSALERLYAKLPKLECKGLCQKACGAAPMQKLEWDRIVFRLKGVPKVRHHDPADGLPFCPMLDTEGRCEVYDIRPLICRLWGLVDSPLMRCSEGCVPEKWLTDEEAFALENEIRRISPKVDTTQVAMISPAAARDLDAIACVKTNHPIRNPFKKSP